LSITTDTTVGPKLGLGRKSIKSVLTDKHGLSASLPEVLGAVGISIFILAAAGFGIGAGVNFSQDATAKGTLDSVKAAQVLQHSKTGAYGDVDALKAGDSPALTQTSDSLKIAASDNNYCAAVKSGSITGTVFYLNAKTGEITEDKDAADAGGIDCPTFAD